MTNDAIKSSTRPLIGWREWVTLHQFGNAIVKAKVDTGARSSAIHATNIKTFTDAGHDMVAFQILPDQHSSDGAIDCIAAITDRRPVRNTGGEAEERYFISTEIGLGDATLAIELSLAHRVDMGFRMLLGRTAVRNRYLIDPGKSYLIGKAPPGTQASEHLKNGDPEDADDNQGTAL